MASRRIKVEPGQRQVKVRGGNEGTPTETSLHTKRNTYRSSPRIGEEIKEESSTEEEFESHRTRRRFLDQSQATHRTPRPRQDSRSRIVPNIPGPQRQIIPPECPEPPNTSPTSSCASHVLVSMGNETVTPNVGGLRLQTPPRDYTQRQRLQRRRQMRHSEAVKEETGERDIREMDQAIQRRFARLRLEMFAHIAESRDKRVKPGETSSDEGRGRDGNMARRSGLSTRRASEIPPRSLRGIPKEGG